MFEARRLDKAYRLFERRPVRIAALSVAVLLAVTGGFLFAFGSVIHANLLNTSFYSKALDENRAYERVYEEVLADPSLARQINQSLGISDRERSLAVSALRSLIPPRTLQEWSEDGIVATVDYLAGRRDDLKPNVNLSALPLDRSEATTAQVRAEVAEAPAMKVGSVAGLVSALAAARDAISEGERPESIPEGDVSAESLPAITAAILSPLNPETRAAIEEQVFAHLTADDIRGALAIAAPYIARFAQSPDGDRGGGSGDPLDEVSAQINGWLQPVADGVAPLRQVVRRYGPWMLPLSIVFLTVAWLLAGAAGGGDAFKRTAIASGVVILGAVVTGLLFWTLAPGVIEAELAGATGSSVLSAAPESVRMLVDDIRGSFVSVIRLTGTASMLWIGVAGVISTVIPLGIELGQRRGRLNIRHPMWVPVGAWVLIVAGMAWGPFALQSRVEALAEPCNGRVALCSLRYDQVTFPGTHNSMSTSADGWIFPFQDASMRRQLEEGVRVFLIDAHHWGSPDEYLLELNEIPNLSSDARNYLAGLQGRFTSAPAGVFLCHASCWLGAIELEAALAEIKSFMEEHPRDVVTLIIQDEVPAVEIVEVFESVGLDELAHAQGIGGEWPTLGDMIDSGRRLVVFAENSSGPATWLHHAWAYAWDTRFDYTAVGELDCEPNRGDRESALLLANHWIKLSVPDRSDAAVMNSRATVLDRVADCKATQGRAPNFIAVDFFRIGELLRAVDEVNGIGVR